MTSMSVCPMFGQIGRLAMACGDGAAGGNVWCGCAFADAQPGGARAGVLRDLVVGGDDRLARDELADREGSLLRLRRELRRQRRRPCEIAKPQLHEAILER